MGSLYLTDIVNPGDLQGVRQEVGVMADLESLVVAVQERGLRLVIGFEPSSTSDRPPCPGSSLTCMIFPSSMIKKNT